jgi:hypothetical protein
MNTSWPALLYGVGAVLSMGLSVRLWRIKVRDRPRSTSPQRQRMTRAFSVTFAVFGLLLLSIFVILGRFTIFP